MKQGADGAGDTGGTSTGSEVEAAPPPMVPPELLLAVLSRLPPNEVALSARRTCRAAAQHFAEEHHRTAAIGQPLPPHAAGPLEEAATAFRGITLNSKLYTLSVAAASGSEASLEVAWRLLQPCLFPELLHTDFYLDELPFNIDDAGTAAAKRGHISALAWLLDRCPGLVNRIDTLEAAAKHCSLPQLQEAWGLLSAVDSSLSLDGHVLAAAAEAPMFDAIPKMQWVLQEGGCSPTSYTAVVAARSGDLARLRWLRERGCPCNTFDVLAAALQHADLSVADWLVDEVGCPLPGAGDECQRDRQSVLEAAAASGSVGKLRWLRDRGLDFMLGPVMPMVSAAVGCGHLEMLRFLQQEGGDEVRLMLRNPCLVEAVIRSGSVETAEYLLDADCCIRCHDDHMWRIVGQTGSVDMVRWLLGEAGADLLGCASDLIEGWPETTAPGVHNAQLLEALRMDAGTVSFGREEPMLREAACRSDVALLRFLHEELGFGLGPGVLAAAAGGGCEAVMEWLVERGCAEGNEWGLLDKCYLKAGQRGNLAALECLRRLGVPRGEGLLSRAVGAWALSLPLPVVQWLWGQGARISGQQLQSARRAAEERPGQEGVEVVEWLEGRVERV